jgi:hypothetical protein
MGLFVALESKLRWILPLPKWQPWLPLYGLVGGLFIWLVDIVSGQDFSLALDLIAAYLIFAAILIGISLANWRHWRSCSATIATCLFLAWIMCSNAFEIHARCRWLLGSSEYKAAVLAQPQPPAGGFKHMDWDGWGWAGMDTEVYVAFDPDDSLAAAANRKASGPISGIPCGAQRVGRLEVHW